MTHHHDGDCGLTPAEHAEIDQAVAKLKDNVNGLVEHAQRYLDRGDDDAHAASGLAVRLVRYKTHDQMSLLLGFALVRMARDRRAQMCPCLPGAPEHEHLTGGYALTAEERSGVEWRLAHGQPAWPEQQLAKQQQRADDQAEIERIQAAVDRGPEARP